MAMSARKSKRKKWIQQARAALPVRLRPGKYVAAGTRSGYRDVRVEFTVTGEPMEGPVVVRCEEPVG